MNYSDVNDDVNDANLLREELADLADLLGDIRSGTKLLIDNGNSTTDANKKIRLNTSSNAAAWAKSTTPRVGVKVKSSSDNIAPCNLTSSLEVEKAEKYIRKRSAAYSIGSKLQNKSIESPAPPPLYYNANIEASSSYKRSKGSVFSKTVRTINIGRNNNDNNDPINIDSDQQPKSSSSDVKKVGEKAYSFGKAPRVNKMTTGTTDSNPSTTYDVEKAEKYLLPNTPSLKLMKPLIDNTKTDADDNDAPNIDDVKNRIVNDDLLSTRCRAPAAIIKPETEKKMTTIVDISKLIGTPGPGQYDVDKVFKSDHSVSTNKKRSVGKLYFDKTKIKLDVALRRAWAANAAAINDNIDINNLSNINNITPGPNQYDVLSADRYLRESRPNIVITAIPDDKLDDKHIQRKRYWEEKAKDLRETHDYMKDVNESFISSNKNTRSVVFQKEKSLDETFENSKALKVMKRRKEETSTSLTYDVKHTLTEKKVPVLLDIDKQIRSSKVFDNPRVAQVLAEREMSKYERDKYYGPQLPVPWVVENKNQTNQVDNGYDSEMEEVMQIIRNRDPNKSSDVKTKVTSETAENYMRSIYSGTMTKSTVMMRKSEEKEFMKLPEGPQDFLGPQLPYDWTELNKGQGRALRMDLGKGRDEVKVHGKGLVQVIEFADINVDDDDQIGPGRYETSTRFGEDAKGVPFKLNVSRRDAFGPHGELPESAQEPLAAAIGDSYFDVDMLDIDYAIAKDEATKKPIKGLPLYQKDRYEEEKLDLGQADHVGGLWFKGMAEEGLNRKALVDISKMQGRDDEEDEKKILENDEEFAEVKLDIEVKDWNPRMAKPITFKMADPESMPRFPKESDAADLAPLSPNRDFVKVRNKMAFIDMSKQAGREDVDNEKQLVIKEVEGDIDLLLADQLAIEREANLKIAKEITGKLKRIPEPIDMSKNSGREEKVKVIEEPPIKEASSPTQPRVKGGVGDWSKQKGRDENVDLSKLDVLLEKEELDLEVNPIASSRFKQPKSALSWDKSKSINRFEEVKSAANDLDYGDVDGSLFKKGSSKVATNMNSRAGRGEDEEKELFKQMLGNEEVLDVVPDDTVMMRNKSSSSFGKSSSSRSLLSDDAKKTKKGTKKKQKNDENDEVPTTNTINKKTVSFGENTEKKLSDLDIALTGPKVIISPPPTPLISIPDSNIRSPPNKLMEGFTDVTTSQMIEKLDESLKQMKIDA